MEVCVWRARQRERCEHEGKEGVGEHGENESEVRCEGIRRKKWEGGEVEWKGGKV